MTKTREVLASMPFDAQQAEDIAKWYRNNLDAIYEALKNQVIVEERMTKPKDWEAVREEIEEWKAYCSGITVHKETGQIPMGLVKSGWLLGQCLDRIDELKEIVDTQKAELIKFQENKICKQ